MDKVKIDLVVAGIVFNTEKNKVLLIKRTDSMWGNNVWSIPGGHIEYGESVKEALIRELKEELNLKILDINFLEYEEFKVPSKPNTQYISLNFIVFAKEFISPNKEIKEARWIELTKLSKINHKISKKGINFIKQLIN